MISVVLATFNEEKNITQCLESVKDWAGEIIVVDGSSIDKTRELAKKFKAKVIKTVNKPNFHINKQMAIDKAKGNLILQLDADEVVDEELCGFIQHINQKLNNKPNAVKNSAWWLKRKNLFLGHWLKKGGQYPDPVIRLFIKGKASLPMRDIHEQMKVIGKTGWADGHLLHYSNPCFKDYCRKFKKYTDFKANQLIENGLKINLITATQYLLIKPIATFLKLFIRHKGFVDGIYGFLFAFFSGLHHPMAYLKIIRSNYARTN